MLTYAKRHPTQDLRPAAKVMLHALCLSMIDRAQKEEERTDYHRRLQKLLSQFPGLSFQTIDRD